jgi:hypothetical protein
MDQRPAARGCDRCGRRYSVTAAKLFKGLTETFEGFCATLAEALPNIGRGQEIHQMLLVCLT